MVDGEVPGLGMEGEGQGEGAAMDRLPAIAEGKVRKASSQRALHARQSLHIPAC